ncbi:EAL domain-containing protein [Oxalobacter vibrioformis]|uniref:EAL domain-containing protein n=1 Tax=Oxalobacter vibrioformis TaxID=933080 RepID=A0A9E9LWX0_9BURK|nr:EAL domain-containing protein [Oxalobacter vibrioformis]WAW10202.1 EAL domain-containing protein [Oxalobacter vibrioformis]
MAEPKQHMSRQIAEEIVERSPSVSIRVTGPENGFSTLFVTENISSYGYSREDFVSGKIHWIDLVHPDDVDMVSDALKRHDEENTDQFSMVYRIRKADGTPMWITDATIVERSPEGKVIHYDCIMRDYTEAKSNIDKIEDSQRQKVVLNNILQGLHDVDLDKALQTILDRAGVYLDISRITLFEDSRNHTQCKAIHEWFNTGISPMMGRDDFVLNYENDLPEVTRSLMESGCIIINSDDDPKGSKKRFEMENVRASAMFSVYIQEEHFGFLCFDECVKNRDWDSDTIAFLENVTRLVSTALLRRRNEQAISNMALTDQLTGLPNRYYLETRLNHAVTKAKEIGQSGYVLFIDMDDFKIINDGYGHDYGDVILKAFASFLLENYKSESEIFRFGGDEFVILLHPENAGSVQRVINGLLARAQMSWNVLNKSFYCTLSIGVVAFPEENMDSKDIIKHADIAMYQAKRSGKNNYAFYNATQDNDSVERAELEKEMRESIDNNFSGFSVFYQPQTDNAGMVIGAEALLRWTLSDGTQVPPIQFIPLAEYLGLIVPVGEFVLRESAQVCRRVNETHPEFWTSINVSIRQFQQQDFLQRVMMIMEETGVNTANIVFEITEGMAMYDITRMKSLSEEFREHGIRISMDDFGTGYSSLSNMRELPIDIVKIDRTFIRDITTDAYSKSFIRLIIDLVHSMGRKVCVEGVETAEQLKYCQECNADYVQGFHLHVPVSLDEFEKIINLKQD